MKSNWVIIIVFLSWGFYAHRQINRLAVFLLPSEMFGFFKANIETVTAEAVNPDRRRYAVVGEAERHYIDLDAFSQEERLGLPTLSWERAKALYGEDTLRARGIVPWQIIQMRYTLSDAFRAGDRKRILRTATDLGHYIADAHVPLHTTKNYNGQLTNQHGIHGFWESRLPELYMGEYDLLLGKAKYEKDLPGRVWKAVYRAHAALDSVFAFEKVLKEDRKYTVEERNGNAVKTYSREISFQYHKALDRQVERQMRAAIQMIADVWFTAWVDAGQPDLEHLGEEALEEVPEVKRLNVREESG